MTGILKVVYFSYVVTAVFLFGNADMTWIPQIIGTVLAITCALDVLLIRLANSPGAYISLNIVFYLSLVGGQLINWNVEFFKTIIQVLLLAIISLHCSRRIGNLNVLLHSIILGNILLIFERVINLGSWNADFGTLRYEGFAGNPNDYSFMLFLGIMAVIYLLVFGSFLRRSLLILNAILVLFLIELVFYAGSRAMIFDSIFVLLFYGYYYFKSSRLFGKFMFTIGLISVVYVVGSNLDEIQVASRIVSAINTGTASGSDSDFSTRSRLLLIEEGFRLWIKKPVFGFGTNMFRDVNEVREGYYAHNNYIELLTNNGMLGFFLFYSFHFVLARLIWISRFTRRQKRFFYLVLFVLLVADIAMVSYYHKLYILFLMYIIGYVKNNKNINPKNYVY